MPLNGDPDFEALLGRSILGYPIFASRRTRSATRGWLRPRTNHWPPAEIHLSGIPVRTLHRVPQSERVCAALGDGRKHSDWRSIIASDSDELLEKAERPFGCSVT